jgi:transcriptional regulator with XRE-family HTH domain
MNLNLLKDAFGRTVRRLRQSQGLSQERLAEMTGLDRTYISGVERRHRNVSLDTAERFVPVRAPDVERLSLEVLEEIGHELS